MKTLLFLLGASSLAFGQSLTSDQKPSTSKHFIAVEMSSVSNYDKNNTEELIVTYEEKKLKKASVFSADGKLLQTSSKTLINEKRLPVGEYLIKIEFQDGTSTSTKFTKK